jgi:hypothetical protein
MQENTKKQRFEFQLAFLGFLARLHFGREDEGDTFLQILG